MARKRYRWCDKRKELVLVAEGESNQLHYVQTFKPFVSPIDGTFIDDPKAYRAHMKQHNVVPAEFKSEDKYEGWRKEQAERDRMCRDISDAYEIRRNEARAKARFG